VKKGADAGTRRRLAIFDEDAAAPTVMLSATEPIDPAPARRRRIAFSTRTGALVRVDGVVAGAFDAEHGEIELPGDTAGIVTLEVERRALPTSGLPPRDGPVWRRMLARETQPIARELTLRDGGTLGLAPVPSASTDAGGLALVGHSHLDVAWLWTYEEAARKAVRTFATAVRQLELDPAFVYAQSQPQLYAWVAEREPELFARVAALARAGRFDASGASLWVECDANLLSGESILRQLAFGIRFCEARLGTSPTVAWLPDSFGFANTWPTLLRHAGIGAFGTTKLSWNDTTPFPYARFLWEGPDGSRVTAAAIRSIQGDFEPARVATARARGDLLLVGRGNGGGGATDAALIAARSHGTWTRLGDWFAAVACDPALPVRRDELYLEQHRGVATTHHDVKARSAALERALGATERELAWAYALRATPFFLDEARGQLAHAWELVLRGQTHDVVPGSAIGPAYEAVFADYDEADALVAHVGASARSVLPTSRARLEARPVPPQVAGRGFELGNDALVARIARDGSLRELRVRGGPNLVRRANRLALYVDRPAAWDAWNIDAGYAKRPARLRATGCEVVDGALEVRYRFGRSRAVARLSLDATEPFLRVDLAVAWAERHRLLRVENEFTFAARTARFGSPHGSVARPPAPRTPRERAKFEAPGQRFARVDAPLGGVAVLALDTYGWSLEERDGRTRLGHSLLRAPTWPDPSADRGEQHLSFGYVPLAALATGELETLWERFAGIAGVPMFVSGDPRAVVAATKLADDGDGVVVRVRECDGAALVVRLACGPRAFGVASIDALERPLEAPVELLENALVFELGPHEVRTFRVRLR